jgi:2-dehydropantoate 2-reductase
MNILVMGAGAVGSAFGAFLRKDGHPVTLIGRRDHLESIRRQGLSVTGIWGDHVVTGFSLETSASRIKDPFDAIFICVKSYDTAEAALEIKPLLKPDTLLISLQNGLGNMEAISASTGHPLVLGGRVIFGITVTRPGAIKITVYAEPVMIGFPASGVSAVPAATRQKAEALAAAIDQSGIPCRYTGEIEKYLWAKMLYNCALNPLGAIHRVHYGAFMGNPEWKAQMDGIVREIFAVARARGVPLFWETPEEFLKVFYGKLVPDTYHHRSSMLQDIEKGRRTEIASMSGMIVAYGKETGISTPLNQEMVEHVIGLQKT